MVKQAGKVTVKRGYTKTIEVEVEDLNAYGSHDELLINPEFLEQVENKLEVADPEHDGGMDFKSVEVYERKTAMEKPPLGVMPKQIAVELFMKQRYEDLAGAIARYKEREMKPKKAWVKEYNQLHRCMCEMADEAQERERPKFRVEVKKVGTMQDFFDMLKEIHNGQTK